MAGEPATKDLFDGIDTTWNRAPGGAAVHAQLAEAIRSFDPEHPEQIVPGLLAVRSAIAGMKGPWTVRELEELDEATALCGGLWLDATADRWDAVAGGSFAIRAPAIRRSNAPLRLVGVSLDGAPTDSGASSDLPYNQAYTRDLTWTVPASAPDSQPYWLVEPKQGDAYAVRDPLLVGAGKPTVVRLRFRPASPSTEFDSRPAGVPRRRRSLGELRKRRRRAGGRPESRSPCTSCRPSASQGRVDSLKHCGPPTAISARLVPRRGSSRSSRHL